jgi:hypothetical protein
MANSENQVELKLNLDISGVQQALYDMIGSFNGTDKEFDRISKKIQDSFKGLQAAIKRYGADSKEAIAANAAYQRSLTSLVANGIDPAVASFITLDRVMLGAGQAAMMSSNNIKKSNMAWTNIALVVQDLPYGFRGIQNNLPALFGSMAGGAGAAYLAFSAVVAAITAWDMGLFGVKKKTEDAKKAQDSYNESLKTAMGSAFGEISQIKALISVVENQGLSIDKRRTALKKLQDEYPAYFKNMSTEKTSINNLTTATDSLTSAIIARAQASAMSSEIEKKALEQYANTKEIEKNETAILNLTNARELLSKKPVVKQGMLGTTPYKYETKSPYDLQTEKIKELEKANSKLRTSNEVLGNSIAQLQNSINFRTQTSIALETKQEKTTKDRVKKEKVQYFDLTKAVDDYYKTKSEFAVGDDKLQKSILEQQQATYDDLLSNNLISTIQWYDKTAEIYKKIYELNKKINDEQSRDAEKFANDRIKNVEAQLDTELKIHRKNIDLQRNDIQKAMAAVAVMAATSFDSSAIAAFLKKFEELGFKLQALPDRAKLFAEEFNSIMANTLVSGFTEIGNQLGEVFSGGDFKISSILSIMADALIQIGKALILYSALVQSAKKAIESGQFEAAIPLGIAAIAAGTALKNKIKSGDNVKKFANGGIISGPTMGLMGEYPGAKNNPEVVAPLDKLKDMIGGGGGTFVLRGQDLLLSVNRAQKSSNLKGQNISLI